MASAPDNNNQGGGTAVLPPRDEAVLPPRDEMTHNGISPMVMSTNGNEIVVACDANPAKFGRISLLVKPNKDSIKVDGITVSVPSSSCTLDSTEPKARKKSGVDSPGGRSWRIGEVVDTIGGPIIPMSKRMTSNIISASTTVGSSTARSVTVVENKKKKSSGGYKCTCGCGGRVQGNDMYMKSCAQRLGVPHDPHGVIKKMTERQRIKARLKAEERLAAAGLSVNEDELGDDVIQALVIVIIGKKVTAFPEVCNSLLHHMPTLLENKTPTLREAIEMSGAALYLGYTGQDDVDEESFRFLKRSNKNKNPVFSKMDGSSISKVEAKETFGFASSVVYTCKSKLNARRVEAALQTHWEDHKFGYRRLWRMNDMGAKFDSTKDVGKAHTVFLTISPLVQELVDGGELLINN